MGKSINSLRQPESMVNKYELQEKLKALISDYLKQENIVLVDLKLQSQGKKFILRILVDEPGGGISLDRCAYLNDTIGQLLERENLIESSYVLEVSSPGIDRPLVSAGDFSRCVNRRVRIFLNRPREQAYEISGMIVSVTDAGIDLDSGDRVQQIPFDQIRKAKQVI